jgi:prepilin-type N-terminal cleavage/methylation domain-containing protein
LSAIRNERGFTMIELLIAMPMLLVLLAGLTITLTNMMHVTDKTQEETTLQTEARATFSTLASDIRQAFVGDGTDPIIAATATSITFESPDRYPTTTSGTTQSSFHLRKITYTLTNGVLQRQFMTSTNVFPTAPPWAWPGANGALVNVLGSVTNTDVFSYYTAAGAQTSPPTALGFPISDTTGIRAVGIKFSLTTGGTQPKTFTESQTIALRETDS